MPVTSTSPTDCRRPARFPLPNESVAARPKLESATARRKPSRPMRAVAAYGTTVESSDTPAAAALDAKRRIRWTTAVWASEPRSGTTFAPAWIESP